MSWKSVDTPGFPRHPASFYSSISVDKCEGSRAKCWITFKNHSFQCLPNLQIEKMLINNNFCTILLLWNDMVMENDSSGVCCSLSRTQSWDTLAAPSQSCDLCSFRRLRAAVAVHFLLFFVLPCFCFCFFWTHSWLFSTLSQVWSSIFGGFFLLNEALFPPSGSCSNFIFWKPPWAPW